VGAVGLHARRQIAIAFQQSAITTGRETRWREAIPEEEQDVGGRRLERHIGLAWLSMHFDAVPTEV
jgi:hypothetical protein